MRWRIVGLRRSIDLSLDRTRQGVNSSSVGEPGIMLSQMTSPYRAASPYPRYAWLRERGRIVPVEPTGVCAVGRYRDVAAVLGSPATFSSSVMAPADPVLLGADPPQHPRSRSIVRAALSRGRIAGLEARAATIADDLVGRMVQVGHADVVRDLAEPLPIEITAALLGVGGPHLVDFRRWSRAVVLLGTGAAASTDRGLPELVADLEQFLMAELEGRRARPTGDLMGALVAGSPDRSRLSAEQALSVAKLLLIAGIETTTNLIANAVLSLLRHPQLLAAVRRNDALVPAVLEETLRYESPVQFVYRLARDNAEVGGTPVRRGTVVMAVIGSANRDEQEFTEPATFRLDRRPNRHMAFGTGPHACLGAQLARAEARAALRALVRAAPGLVAEQDIDDVEWAPSTQLRGPSRLGVKFSSQSGSESV
jgi:cytochrome P450